jgi:ABC-type multidrug transport system fused ATPase/permease subunit
MLEVLNLKSEIQDRPGAVQTNSFSDKIEFDRVWFKYRDEWVLKDFSCTIQRGEIVAIVGPTGAGKSTLIQLLARLYDPQKGEIRFDGNDLRNYSQKSLREQIAFVPQKPFLFFDTVYENIAFGRNYSREEVTKAAQLAFADEFIEELPRKYDSTLAEAGKSLSGGQQQRLAIARALVKGSPILVLDEATSSLDAVSEHRIRKAIDALSGRLTQIIVAHRLSTIERADRIIYLERGEKVAEGSRQELLAQCKQFKLMWDLYHANADKIG